MDEEYDQKPVLSRCASAIPTAAPATDLPQGPADAPGWGVGGCGRPLFPSPSSTSRGFVIPVPGVSGLSAPRRFPARGRGVLRPPGTRALRLGFPAPRYPGRLSPCPRSPPSEFRPIPACPERSGYAGRGGCSAGPTSPGWPHLPAPGAEGPGSGLRHQRSRARAGSRLTAQRRRFTHSTECSGSAAPIAPIAAGAASSAGRGARGHRGGAGPLAAPAVCPAVTRGGGSGRRRCVTRYAERVAGTREEATRVRTGEARLGAREESETEESREPRMRSRKGLGRNGREGSEEGTEGPGCGEGGRSGRVP